MSDKLLKVLNAFYAAKRVHHYYWMHTDGDDHVSRTVSIENIQRIIEVLTGSSIEKEEIDEESEFHRAFIERYNGGQVCKIWIMAGEPESWKRFAAVKEMCHVLIDGEEDFQSDPCKTIGGLKDGGGILDEHSTPEADSEYLAEIIAMELIYPLEFRRDDRKRLKEGATLEELAADRNVPAKYISLGASDTWYEVCLNIWRSLKDVEPPNLNEYF